MHSHERASTTRQRHHFSIKQRFIAVLSALALTMGLSAITLSSVHAATPGIEIDVLHNGSVISNNAVVPEGDDITLRVQYDAAEDIAGKEIVISLPSAVALNGSLPSNQAIESITDNGDGTVSVLFKNPLPADVTEGAFAINLRAVEVNQDTESPITWTIGADGGGVTIIVEDEEVPPVVVEDGYAKSVNPSNLDDYVNTTGYPDYEFDGIDPDIVDEIITYTLVLSSSEARSNYSISDELEAGLGFIPDSFSAELTTSSGTTSFPFAPTPSGNSFTETVDVPAQSTLRITYQVRVTDVALLEAALQAQYADRDGTPGDYQILLSNDAVFGGTVERSADVRLRGNIPGVGIGENFAKSGNWTLRDALTDADGNLQPAAEMTYTLRANLTPWDERNPNFTLNRNVVISDVLIDQASWQTGDDFITVNGTGPIASLTEASDCPTAAEFADDSYIGQYCVNGNRLLINVGKDNTTDLTIHVKAQLDTVAGLTGTNSSTVIDGMHYPWNNRAQFYYTTGDPVNRDHNAGLVVLPENYQEGVNDSSAFDKAALDSEVRVNPGEAAVVPYRFTIDTSKENIDPLNARIIDEVDTDIFDISNLDSLPVTGTYGGQALTRDHFALSIDADGNLVIELSADGKELVEGLPEGQMWIVDVELTTIPFDGKQTFEIYNRATLITDGSEWDYWSDFSSEATSFGDEAELRKRLYNKETGAWVQELDALIENGEFVDNKFIYSIELIPRGNYGQAFPVQIFTREDVLPDAVDFLGFVTLDGAGAPDLDTAENGPVDINGNVEARYADGVVTVRQQDGTSLNRNQGRIIVYFAVEAHDADAEILNEIVGSETTIKPVGDPSIDIEKWNDEGEEPEYDESGALLNDGFEGDFDEGPGKSLPADEITLIRFTISNDGRENLVDVAVSDELTSGKGRIENLVCIFPDGSQGTAWDGPFEIGTQFDCAGILPELLPGDKHANLAKVTGMGILSGIEVDDEDAWHGFVEPVVVDSDDDNAGTAIDRTDGTPLWLTGLALALIIAGATMMAVRRTGAVTVEETSDE